jgi:hypothetical protein
MNDVSSLAFRFCCYPVTMVSDGVMAMLREPGLGVAREPAKILREAKEVDEGVDWWLESRIGTAIVLMNLRQRFDGEDIDGEDYGPGDTPGHGGWSIYLPSEPTL